MTGNDTSQEDSPLPMTFKVVSRQKASSWKKTVSYSIIATAILAILLGVIIKLDAKNDSNFPSYLVYFLMDFVGMETWLEEEVFWLVGGASLGLFIFETTQGGHGSGSEEAISKELGVTICPLGVQRYTKSSRGKIKYQPLLPTEAVQDCIVREHVGAFSVTSHVMFRIIDGTGKGDANQGSSMNTSLIEAFPDTSLTFDQCYALRSQIQAALNDIR